MNVLIFYMKLDQGGVQRMIVNVANYLASKKYHVSIYLVKKEGQYLTMLDPKIQVIGIEDHSKISLIKVLYKVIRANKIDIVFTAVSHFNLIAILLKILTRSKKTKFVISERSNTFKEFFRNPFSFELIWFKLGFFLIPIFYRLADHIIAVSNGVAKDLSKIALLPLNRITIIHNPAFSKDLVLQSKQQVIHPWINNKDHLLVIAVGRLSAQKDFSTLIKSFKYVTQKINAKLLILGDGPLENRLHMLINKLHLNDSVNLIGFQPNPVSWIDKSNLFVLSSKWEGFGNVIVEALATGKTVVSTNCKSGPSEILEDGRYGYLTGVNKPYELANTIIQALENPMCPKLLLGRATEFDIDLVMSKYEDVFSSNRN